MVSSLDQEEANRYADFWRYEIGANVIPAVNKRAIVEWKKYQDSPIPQEQHNEWKEQGKFTNAGKSLSTQELMQTLGYACYYCDYKADNEANYEHHVANTHHRPAYPNKAEIYKEGLKAQGKSWEI